jgi:putative ABC transport system permease protein
MADAQVRNVFADWNITRRQWAEVQQNPTGVVMSRLQAALWHKKIGDSFTIIAPQIAKADGTTSWTFKVLDIGADIPQAPGGYILGNYDYFDRSLPISKQGKVSEIDFLAVDPTQAPALAQQIDHIFANSATPTESQTEKMAYAISNNFGGLDVNTLTYDIALAGLGMILFLTGNVVAQSVRERLGEFAALKTIGFSDSVLVGLVVLEATILCLSGAALGVSLAEWLASELPAVMPPGMGLPLPSMSAGVVISAVLSALALALISAALPIMRLIHMDIAAVLAKRT